MSLFPLLVLLLHISPRFPLEALLAQTPPLPVPLAGTSISFDVSGLDVLGKAETLATADLALCASTMDLNVAGSVTLNLMSIPIKVGTNTQTLDTLFKTMAAGLYKIGIREIDAAGNRSTWAQSQIIALDPTAPAAPANIKITVTVTITTP